MRHPEDLPARPDRRVGGRGRAVLIGVAVAAVVLVLSARGVARVYTDYLWFQSLGVEQAWERRWGYQGVLALLFTLIFFTLAATNLLIANRLAPAVVVRRSGDELVERYREIVGGRQRAVWLMVSLALAFLAGVGSSAQWKNWVLFRYGGSFGSADRLNHTDVGFYVFKLPFLDYVLSWTFASLVIVTLLVATAHYLTGALHLPGTGAPASTNVKAHLSVLFAAMSIFKAIDYGLDRYRLTLSDRGVVNGALYTDVHATLPARTLLLLVALLCGALFLLNVRRRGWGLPLIGLGLWVVVALLAGTLYPAAVQKLRVSAKQSALEATYIARNISATRSSFGLDHVEEHDFDYQDDLTDQTVTANASTVSNIRLLDPEVVGPTFTTLQSKFDFYQFSDLDVDRYRYGDQETEVIVGARELNPDAIPVDTWEGRHLSYTHGYGVALAPANAVNADGEPDFSVSDVPVRVNDEQLSQVTLDRPEIYFGEGFDSGGESSYAIVGTSLKEESFGGSSRPATQYQGGGGVAIDSALRKAAFALRFGDLEPLTSAYLQKGSKVLYNRGILDRVSQVAPFLTWDHDPYPILVDGRIKYVIDGYTTSANVPYSEQAVTGDLAADAGLRAERFNYIRNSVKAVVDAYDGSVKLYTTDHLYRSGEDPILAAYRAAFPELFSDGASMPDEIRAHLRYPEDLFRVQTAMWGRYHLTDPGEFYKQQDRWDVAQNPPAAIRRTVNPDDGASTSIAPNYLQMRLPTERSDEFVIFRPFVPHTMDGGTPKQTLNAFMVGRSDPGSYGTLATYTMTETTSTGGVERNRDVDGPLIAHENMVSNTSTRLSERLTQLNATGGSSVVKFGNMVLVPIERGILYVRPIYVASEREGAAQQLRIVVVSIGGKVAIGETLAEALGQLFPSAQILTREGGTTAPPGGSSETPTVPSESSTGDAQEKIARAVELFDEADATLRAGGAGSLDDYQTKVAQAQQLVREAQEALAAESDTPAEPSADSG